MATNYDEKLKMRDDGLAYLKEMKARTAQGRKLLAQLGTVPVVRNGGDLYQNLAKFIPPDLMPGNVGHIDQVTWPFWETFNFALGEAPVISNALRRSATFQVTQEAAFMFMAISRYSDVYDSAGALAPLQVQFQDKQSSRFFNDAPIPMQMIGQTAYPTLLPTPMLLMPNAMFQMDLSCFLPDGASITGADDTDYNLQFILYGYKMRVEDAGKILSTLFG